MKIYTRVYNASLGQLQLIESEIDINFRSAVASISDLPISGNAEGDARMTIDTDHLFVYVNGSFVDQGVYDIQDLLQQKLMQELS